MHKRLSNYYSIRLRILGLVCRKWELFLEHFVIAFQSQQSETMHYD